jgi:hypothetical protein
LESLLSDIHDQSAEILCQMMQKIATNVVKRAQAENAAAQERKQHSGRKPLSQCAINLDYVESVLARLFPFRNVDGQLSSRVRFKIQDLIDEYTRDWKHVIYGERTMVDDEGFNYKYVPKQQINLNQDGSAKGKPTPKKGGAAARKGSAGGETVGASKAYIYVKKQTAAEETAKPTSFKDLLGGLKPSID